MFQSKRDILSETKYIELVLVADHQEVSENTTANDNKNDLTNINDFFIYIVSNGSQLHQGVASLATHKGGLLVAGLHICLLYVSNQPQLLPFRCILGSKGRDLLGE